MVHTEQTDAPERSVTLNALPGVQQAEPHRQGWEPVQRFGDAESPIRQDPEGAPHDATLLDLPPGRLAEHELARARRIDLVCYHLATCEAFQPSKSQSMYH